LIWEGFLEAKIKHESLNLNIYFFLFKEKSKNKNKKPMAIHFLFFSSLNTLRKSISLFSFLPLSSTKKKYTRTKEKKRRRRVLVFLTIEWWLLTWRLVVDWL